jgi:hypothetical protein
LRRNYLRQATGNEFTQTLASGQATDRKQQGTITEAMARAQRCEICLC